MILINTQKKETSLKSLIHKEFETIRQALDLPDIPLEFNNKGIIGFLYNHNDESQVKILIDIKELKELIKINNNKYLFIMWQCSSIRKRLRFILGHELGHYVQQHRFIKWVKINEKGYNPYLPDKEYRLMNIERKADKIGYLFAK